jgi:SAM-dependent methyltransferase
MQTDKEWFSEWFDSPYYHILYKNRDDREAELFLSNLVDHLVLNKEQLLVDLACGKGRHSIYLNKLGFNVVGVDLAACSITAAKKFENDRLHFEVCDLRNLPFVQKFDVALNLFTSFGYFDCNETNKQVLHQISKCLKPEGILVIDFMNVNTVLQNLIPFQQKVEEGITFDISKRVEHGLIIKRIDFSDAGKSYSYQEEVQVLTLQNFEELLHESNFSIKQVFGNYQLQPYQEQSSDRVIIVAQKL